MNTIEPRLYLYDARLHMTLAGRMFVRVGIVTARVVVVAGTLLAFTSSLSWLRWLAAFLSLVIIDRMVHLGQGDVPIPELLARREINLVHALSPEALALVHRAYEASRLTRVDISLELTEVLISRPSIRKKLRRMNVDPREFEAKLKDFMGREEAQKIMTEGSRTEHLKEILVKAFEGAEAKHHRFIRPGDIFFTLPLASEGLVPRLFTMFEIKPEDALLPKSSH